jgi:hypothetical protein
VEPEPLPRAWICLLVLVLAVPLLISMAGR